MLQISLVPPSHVIYLNKLIYLENTRATIPDTRAQGSSQTEIKYSKIIKTAILKASLLKLARQVVQTWISSLKIYL